MSDLLVKVLEVTDVRLHPNAERLEIVSAGGWEIVSGKGNYKTGDLVVHIPPDAMVPRPLAEQWSVAQYLSFSNSSPDKGRVKAAKLRGFVSYGFFAPNDSNAPVGSDLREHYGIEKYEPPIPVGMQAGQMARNHPLFHTYTDIQNIRNYPDQLIYGEPLVVTEKIHGTNSRVGWIRGDNGLEIAIGTHRTQRKPEDCGVYGLPFDLYRDGLEAACKRIFDDMQCPKVGDGFPVNSLILFGEIFGPGVQDLTYGKEKAWRVFDIAVNGIYLPWNYVEDICATYGLPIVPHVIGVFTFEQLCTLAEGESVLSPGQIKEGLVVRPTYEQTWGRGTMDPQPKRRIFKVISGSYLTRKGGTEYH